MDKYEDLMRRREALFAEWMRWCEANRAPLDGGVWFYGTGVIVTRDGDLWMPAHARSGERVLELRFACDDESVVVTHVADGVNAP